MENPNVRKTLEEFEKNLIEIKSGRCDDERQREIYTSVVKCSDLMQYSAEVADTSGVNWKSLDNILNEVVIAISPKNRLYIH